ncbi:MAG: lamin tail domain-containing protein, partial [Anaerolineales bacterium]|nr:lamin tail domain-containing protein [Anaerolineales bacterium]
TPTLTPTLAGPVIINELLPAPATDWNEDGAVDESDQWIELRNVTTTTVDLSGWFLLGADDSGTAFKVPTDTVLAEGEYLVFYRAGSGIALETDEGDGVVRLLDPGGAPVDEVAYEDLSADASYGRDEAGEWRADWPPSPGAANAAATPSLNIAPKLPDLPTLLRDKLREWFRR